LGRKKEIEDTLDYISRQLEQLNVIGQLPQTNVHSEALAHRAMDVRSAAMVYIAVHIQHESRHFGIVGKTLRLLVSSLIWKGRSRTLC
jgi:hypothetical protein